MILDWGLTMSCWRSGKNNDEPQVAWDSSFRVLGVLKDREIFKDVSFSTVGEVSGAD